MVYTKNISALYPLSSTSRKYNMCHILNKIHRIQNGVIHHNETLSCYIINVLL